ncbi:MAG: hypothetical protein IJE06_00075 [Alistipes sp.]|nr:hypothetical protein [Alistipes sp.]
MRRFILFLIALMCCSCNDFFNSEIGVDDTKNDEIAELIAEQNGDFDASNLMSTLCSLALEIEYYMVDENKEKKEHHKRIIFSDDGTCRILLHRITPKVVGSYGDGAHIWEDVDEYFYSREYHWSFDDKNNIITTADAYGNTHMATILYLSHDALIYEGYIGDEFRGYNPEHKYYSMAKFIADRDSWWEKAESYDVLFREYADENDARLKRMLELIEGEKNEIDDAKFLNLLHNKVVNLEIGKSGDESGCFYGDRSMYIYDNGAYLYSDDCDGGRLPSILVMMDNGVYRNCFTGIPALPNEEYENVNFYVEYEWSYDKQTNVLYTNDRYNRGAEVLYVSDKEAILKGHIAGYPYAGEYGLFLMDFSKLDRESILSLYDTNYRDIVVEL